MAWLSADAVADLYAEASLQHFLKTFPFEDGAGAGANQSKSAVTFGGTGCSTALDLVASCRGVELGISEIDSAFQGGVPTGFVVEIAGPPSTGKSRLATLIAARHAVGEARRALGDPAWDGVSPMSVLYLQADHHLRHCVRSLREAVEYHSAIAWERWGTCNANDPLVASQSDAALGLPRPLEIASVALDGISMVDVASDLDFMINEDGMRSAVDPLQSILGAIQTQLGQWEASVSDTHHPNNVARTRVVVIDSVPSLIRRLFASTNSSTCGGASSRIKGMAGRHDAVASFLQGLKDIAALFNVVIFVTNHVVSSEPASSVTVGAETAARGAFGTTFYHAVNIRMLLLPLEGRTYSGPSTPVALHITKSPICPPHAFAVTGLLDELQCYEVLPCGSGHCLRPSVRVVEALS